LSVDPNVEEMNRLAKKMKISSIHFYQIIICPWVVHVHLQEILN